MLHDRLSTWTFDGATWHQHRGATPPQNYGASLAYDPASGRTILFGGDDGGPLVDETWRLLCRLPVRQRTVLVLRIHLDLSDEEIARLMHCPEPTVRSLAFRALATLRKELT